MVYLGFFQQWWENRTKIWFWELGNPFFKKILKLAKSISFKKKALIAATKFKYFLREKSGKWNSDGHVSCDLIEDIQDVEELEAMEGNWFYMVFGLMIL